MNSKHGMSHSPVELKDDHTKGSESYGRKDNSRGPENDSSHARPGRGHDPIRHSDRHSYGGSRESKRHDDYRRYHDKHADDNDRSHARTSRSDRESRADTYYDSSRRDRSHGDLRNVDSRYGGKSVKREQRVKNQEKQESPRHDGGEYDKYADLRKETHSTRRYPEDKEGKNKEKLKQEEPIKKRNVKEIENSSHVTEPEVETREKRRSLFSSAGIDVANAQHLENDTTKQSSLDSGVLDNPASGTKEGAINEMNAAKAAAMKAAELVNKNIVGFGVGTGRLSTDQKKKLLWGNKKSNPAETSTHWDSNLFSDRERQEKFNKLMSLRVPWWLWPIVGCEERSTSFDPGRKQGGGPVGSQETGGARHRPGEALRSRPAPERWPYRWSRPVGIFACNCCRIEDLRCSRKFNWHFCIGLFILACGSLTGSFASPVEVGYCYLVARKQRCMRGTCIVRRHNLSYRSGCALRRWVCLLLDHEQDSGCVVVERLDTSLHFTFALMVADKNTASCTVR